MSAASRACALAAALLLAACDGGGGSPSAGAAYDPDVPAWRGGCFSEGPAGKIVNGSPSADLRVWGEPCGTGGAAGGFVYLDRFDPVAGKGDVTVLSSAAGARPVVVGPAGGAGGIVPGDTGVRLAADGLALLTLRDVGFVTGELVLVRLSAERASAAPIASAVRVLNYEFLPSGAVLYVGGYDAQRREGDLYLWAGTGSAPALLAGSVSRAEFQMYRLDAPRGRVAYLRDWTATGGGDLHVVALELAPAEPRVVDRGVERMEWTTGGALVWGTRQPNGNTTLRRAAGGDPAAARTVANDVRSWTVVGDAVVYVGGWSILSGTGTLAVDAAPPLGAVAPGAAPQLGVASRSGAPIVAWVEPPAGASDRRAGALRLLDGGAATAAIDDRVAPRAGFAFSPDARFLAYARDWLDPAASGSGSPQPGTGEVRLAGAASPPVTIAARGSMQRIAWANGLVAAVAGYDAASNRGRVEVRTVPAGALVQAIERASPTWFVFGAEGTDLAAIREWDDAMQRGELVLAPVPAGGAPVAVDADVTSFLAPARQRIIYAVRGGGRDGLWLR